MVCESPAHMSTHSSTYTSTHTHTHTHMCVCVCVCERERVGVRACALLTRQRIRCRMLTSQRIGRRIRDNIILYSCFLTQTQSQSQSQSQTQTQTQTQIQAQTQAHQDLKQLHEMEELSVVSRILRLVLQHACNFLHLHRTEACHSTHQPSSK